MKINKLLIVFIALYTSFVYPQKEQNVENTNLIENLQDELEAATTKVEKQEELIKTITHKQDIAEISVFTKIQLRSIEKNLKKLQRKKLKLELDLAIEKKSFAYAEEIITQLTKMGENPEIIQYYKSKMPL